MNKRMIWVLVTMAGLAIIPFATAQVQNLAVQSLGLPAVDVMNATPPMMAVSQATDSTSGQQSEPAKSSKVLAGPAAARTVRCTYAYYQAYGECPADISYGRQDLALEQDVVCTYAYAQAYGSCPKGR